MGLLIFLLEVLRWVVFADVILSWIMRDPEQFPRNITGLITAPLLAPFQRLLPSEKTGGFDLSPIIVLVLISVVQRALY